MSAPFAAVARVLAQSPAGEDVAYLSSSGATPVALRAVVTASDQTINGAGTETDLQSRGWRVDLRQADVPLEPTIGASFVQSTGAGILAAGDYRIDSVREDEERTHWNCDVRLATLPDVTPSDSGWETDVIPSGARPGSTFTLPFAPIGLILVWNQLPLARVLAAPDVGQYTLSGSTITLGGTVQPGDLLWAHLLAA